MVVGIASPPPSAGRSHPTYKEMVMQALTELRDSGGSSRGDISKYIADHFSGLPARHDDLLSVHLRRLRSQGLLHMSGSSYLLPTAASLVQKQKRGPGRPRKNPDSAPSQGVKRGPGRPRKIVGVKRGPGRPRKNPIPMSVPHTSMPAAAKRGRGRPPKNAQILTATSKSVLLPAMASSVTGIRKRGRPPKAKTQPECSVALTKRRGPGRPRKERSLGDGYLKAGFEAQPQAGDVPNGGEVRHLPSSGTSSTEKRGRGRPRKRPLETETIQAGVATLVERRGPGRPRKKNLSAPLPVETEQIAMTFGGTGISASMGIKRGRGRPRKKNPSAGTSAETGIAASMGIKRGRGRPRKENPSAGTSAETGITASMGNKRGRGRPRKNVSFGTESKEAAVEVPRDLAESKPKKDDASVSGNTTETESIPLGERVEVRPADTGEVLMSGEKASTTDRDTEGAMVLVDPIVSNLDNKSL